MISTALKLSPAFAYDLFLNCGQFLFEAGEVLVECPDKGLVGPEGRLWSPLVAVGGTGSWRARLRAVSRHLVYELLQPEHCLPVRSDMLQHRAQTVLQHQRKVISVSAYLLWYKKRFWAFQLTLVRWVTTTLFLTDTFPSWCWNIKCFLTPDRSLQHITHTFQLNCVTMQKSRQT